MKAAVRRFLRANPLVGLLAAQAAIGFAIAAALVAALVAFDINGLGRLFAGADAWPFAVVLWFFLGLTFASALMGSAIMGLARGGDPGGRWVVVRPAWRERARVRAARQ